MLVRETIRSAWRSLISNRLRTALTTLGMIIGVGAVVAVLAVGEGAQASVETRIRSMGSNLLMIGPGAGGRRGGVRGGSVETLTLADAHAIMSIDGVAAVAPETSGQAQVRYLAKNSNSQITGITEAYLTARSLSITSGLGITEVDYQQRRRVAVIGAEVRTALFADGNAVGERIQINGIAFQVVGVLEAKGGGFGSSDDAVLVPLTTHQGVLFGRDYLSAINVQLQDEGRAAETQAAIEQLLRLRHRLRADQENDFNVRSQTEMLETMGAITGTFTALLGSVAAVSLLVGGIGIMNIMLVSVRERTREIGVRMAVGARRRDVLLQFLVEAVVVSIVGGIIGIGFGYLAATLVARFGAWETVVPLYAVFLALGVSVVIGIIFGVGPARRASKLDPVEALRQE